MEMCSLTHTDRVSGASQKPSKIPEYAREYKREWQYIRGVNKKCGEFINRLDFGRGILISPLANSLKSFIKKFLQALEHGRLKDISSFYLKYIGVNNIDCSEEQLDNYRDLYVDPDSLEFDQESYDNCIDEDYPGFKELFELVSLLNDKLKTEESTFNLVLDSDSDSD